MDTDNQGYIYWYKLTVISYDRSNIKIIVELICSSRCSLQESHRTANIHNSADKQGRKIF